MQMIHIFYKPDFVGIYLAFILTCVKFWVYLIEISLEFFVSRKITNT